MLVFKHNWVNVYMMCFPGNQTHNMDTVALPLDPQEHLICLYRKKHPSFNLTDSNFRCSSLNILCIKHPCLLYASMKKITLSLKCVQSLMA